MLSNEKCLGCIPGTCHLLAGGLDRGHSFEELRPCMNHVKGVVAFGETGLRFVEFAKSCGVQQTIIAQNVEDAVHYAAPMSAEGDVILLSPACASWDDMTALKFEETFLLML